MSWKLNARCLGLPPDSFYRRPRESVEEWDDRQQEAKQICGLCVVRPICLEEAWLGGEDGFDSIWGGMNDAERRREWKRRTGKRYTRAVGEHPTGQPAPPPGGGVSAVREGFR